MGVKASSCCLDSRREVPFICPHKVAIERSLYALSMMGGTLALMSAPGRLEDQDEEEVAALSTASSVVALDGEDLGDLKDLNAFDGLDALSTPTVATHLMPPPPPKAPATKLNGSRSGSPAISRDSSQRS